LFIRICILTLCQVKSMNEKIQHIIQEIRTKKNALNNLLIAEKQRVSLLESEISSLKGELTTSNSKLGQLQEKNSELQSLLEEAKAQVDAVSVPAEVGYEHIDEMVREIEYCIGQLKNNA